MQACRDNRKLAFLQWLGSVCVRMPGWYRLKMNRLPVLGRLTALRVPNPPFPPAVVGARRFYFPWAVERCKERYLGNG